MNTIPHNLKFENCEKEIRHFFKGIVVLKETHDLYINNEKYGITLCYLIDNSDKNVIGIEEYNFKDKEKNTNFTENSLEISLMLPGGRQKVELPDYYKKQFKLPILLIDIAAVKEGYEQLNNIYYFYCNNKAFQVYHYKLTIAGKFIVVVPMEIKELNVHTRKVITKSFNREVFGETVTIYCQKKITQNISEHYF
jgi:hypothetical protein